MTVLSVSLLTSVDSKNERFLRLSLAAPSCVISGCLLPRDTVGKRTMRFQNRQALTGHLGTSTCESRTADN